jgi:hypothetical protein
MPDNSMPATILQLPWLRADRRSSADPADAAEAQAEETGAAWGRRGRWRYQWCSEEAQDKR